MNFQSPKKKMFLCSFCRILYATFSKQCVIVFFCTPRKMKNNGWVERRILLFNFRWEKAFEQKKCFAEFLFSLKFPNLVLKKILQYKIQGVTIESFEVIFKQKQFCSESLLKIYCGTPCTGCTQYYIQVVNQNQILEGFP